MSGNFLKFKRRLCVIRTIRAGIVGSSVGLLAAGVWLILTKLAVIDFEPISSLFIGLGLALVAGGVLFLFGGRSDKSLAEELDGEFGLKARVQTMIAYQGEEGELVALQREDAEEKLSAVSVKSYKFKGLPIYITVLAACAAVLVAGFIVPDMRDFVPPEEIEVFELSDMQRAGLNELIRYVESSKMEEEFRTSIADELRDLLSRLENINTVPDMRAALAKSMAVICDITYTSSTATETLDALWDSNNVYLKHLAVTLDASSWSVPDWGDFAERLTEYSMVLMGDTSEDENALVGKASLKRALDSMKISLDILQLDTEDELCAAIDKLFNGNPGGLSLILATIDYHDDTTAREALNQSLTLNSQSLYDAVSLNRINAATGEYTMTRLASLFLVPVPEFERPEFVRTGERPDGGYGSNDKEEGGGNHNGGVGTGATYGSDDIVLDPITGKPIKYAELLDKYNAIMNERLDGDSYTEEQKEAIRKYFDLLYKGVEKKEGN
ncbi:MAG: hypothetical protein IKJ25_01305 [Clostridia bacterium]|nr:hypothetical protein [Clostridia bacterium]